jgi:glycosyltransferase involved in cell wall biosynthesis
MKLIVACSSLDLAAPLSATPAWWQMLKALYEVGADLTVTTYHGSAPDTLWWRGSPNPARLEGEIFLRARRMWRRFAAARPGPPSPDRGESGLQAAVRRVAHATMAPRWRRHLSTLIAREPGIAAVLVVNVPPNHLRGVASHIRDRHGVPVLFYDGDVPASLPSHQGFASGFRIYDGADLAEFDAVICNSEGGADALRALGARAVHVVHYAVDAELYAPIESAQDLDVFFYGHGAEYRAPWIEAMLAHPSRAMPDARFAVRGHGLGDVGRAEILERVSFAALRRLIAASRINLVITRDTHAHTAASSSMRPFELAMMGACIVTNPCGIERWFEPGREVVVVSSADEAVDRYRFLLGHEAERRALGAAARRRALAEHTYRHRAMDLRRVIETYAVNLPGRITTEL